MMAMAASKHSSIRKTEDIPGENQWFWNSGVAILALARSESVPPIRGNEHWVKLPMEKRNARSRIHIACRTGLLIGQTSHRMIPESKGSPACADTRDFLLGSPEFRLHVNTFLTICPDRQQFRRYRPSHQAAKSFPLTFHTDTSFDIGCLNVLSCPGTRS